MRDIREMICSCGGTVSQVETTQKEREEHGCSLDTESSSCCVTAFQCSVCKTRFTVALESPEADYDW
jgi:hypothetical protein